MNKNLKILVAIFATCLALVMPFAITGAFYFAKRSASANLVMDKGIFLEFGNVLGEGLNCKIQTLSNEELNSSIFPNDTIEIKNPYVKILENSVDVFLKARLNYKYFSNETEIFPEENILDEFFVLNENQAISFNENLLPDNNFEWFYFSKNISENSSQENLDALNPLETLEIFDNPKLQISNFTTEFGSPNEVTKIEIFLEIQVIQANTESKKEFLPNELMSNNSTTVNLNNSCQMQYSLANNNIQIHSVTGTDPEISTNQFANLSYSEISFDASNLEGDFLFVSDKGFIISLDPNCLDSWVESGKAIILTSELYAYISEEFVDERETKLVNYLDLCIFDIETI